MKINDLYRIARRNWTVKLICLVLAIFIYFFYITTTTLNDKSVEASLLISEHGTMCLASSIPSEIEVEVKCHPQDLSRISKQNISAYLNLDYYTEPGTYNVPVDIVLDPEIRGIEPLEVKADKSSIEVIIEPKTRSQITLTPSIQGIPAVGYEIAGVTVEPSTVGVFGAQSLVESINTVSTDDVNVDGKHESFTQTVGIFRDNTLVTYNDDEVKVSVNIIPITVTKRIEDQTIYLYGVDPSFYAEVDPKMITLTVTGNQNQLEGFVPELHTLRLDCSRITEPGTYELPVEVTLPSGVRLVSQSNRVAKVSIVPIEENLEEEVLLEGVPEGEESPVEGEVNTEIEDTVSVENKAVSVEDETVQTTDETLPSETEVPSSEKIEVSDAPSESPTEEAKTEVKTEEVAEE